MSEAVEVRESEDLVILPIGEVVSSGDMKGCSLALDRLRDMEREIASYKTILSRAIVAEASRQGLTGKFPLGDRLSVEISSADRTSYDAEKLEDLLRQAGMPEERIAQIVKEEVTHVVVAKELKKAARSNKGYAEILEATKAVEHRAPTVTIRRR